MAAQECRAALTLNPKFEPARAMLDQIQNHQVVGDPRGVNRPMPGGQVRPAVAAPSSNGLTPVALGNSNQPTAATAQASWQTPPTTSNGFGTATRAVGTFDPALPKAASAAQSADYSSDPWATVPAPPK